MRDLLDWIKAIALVLLLVASMYAIWIMAILLVIALGIYIVKTLFEVDTS